MLSALALFVAIQAKNDAIIPVPRPDEWWQNRHKAEVERAKKGDSDLAFIGDSITHGWGGGPEADERFNHETWDKAFGKYKPINLGFSGDRTQHVLWRLQNGELDGVKPKVMVIMIGTNNIGGNTPEQITAGVSSILDWIHAHQGQAKVVLHAIFPRSPNPDNRARRLVEATNRLLEPLAEKKGAIFLDINAKFLDEYGVLSPSIMPDYLHPNLDGYKIWADGLTPTLKKLLG
jgi:beta-glucosidase